MDEEYMNKGMATFVENYGNNNLHGEYLGFSQFIQGCFISKGNWIIDTGNFEAVNSELMVLIEQRIKKHPFLWKILFMIA